MKLTKTLSLFIRRFMFRGMSSNPDVTISKTDRMATIKDPAKHKKQGEAFAEHKQGKVVDLKKRE